MVTFNEIVEANNLLMKLGGEDQLPKLSERAIEAFLEANARIDRAYQYAISNSTSQHMRNVAQILDGTAPREFKPEPERKIVKLKKPTPQKRTSGPGSRGSGLSDRPRRERLAFRNWAREQGMTVPSAGPVPQNLVDAYDSYQEELRKMEEKNAGVVSESE